MVMAYWNMYYFALAMVPIRGHVIAANQHMRRRRRGGQQCETDKG
jgi:hypothetical protein